MLFFVPVEPEASAEVTGWEWWMDGDAVQRRSVSGSQAAVDIEESIGTMSQGLHCLNFRVRNSSGDWSPVSRMLFFVPVEPEATAEVTGWEWWMDGDAAQRRSVSGSLAAVDIEESIGAMSQGLHCLNFRVRNSSGDWSPVSRYLFFVAPEAETTPSPYVGYYYQFNDKTVYVSTQESTDFVLQDVAIDIPDLQEIGDAETGCTYTVDATADAVTLTRQQTVNFALRTVKKDGTTDYSIEQPIELTDETSRQATAVTLGQTQTVSLTGRGDYQVIRFDNPMQQDIGLSSQRACRLRLYDGQGSLQTTVTLGAEPLTVTLAAGRYYAVVNHATGASQDGNAQYTVTVDGLSSPPSVAHVEYEPYEGSGDDLQDYLDSFADTDDKLTLTTSKEETARYTRLFRNTAWQPLYMPLQLGYDVWSEYFDVARLTGTSSAGGSNLLVGELLTAADGDLQANTPYLIRAKKTGTYTIEVSSDKLVDPVATTTILTPNDFYVKGTVSGTRSLKSGMGYCLTGGALRQPNSDDYYLPPFRWYLGPARLRIIRDVRPIVLRIGGSETTAIDEVATATDGDGLTGLHTVYDLTGRHVKTCDAAGLKALPKGVYIVDGRKMTVK